MAYTSQAEIEALLPPAFLTEALDDDRDASADSGLLDAVIQAAGDEIDGLLSPSYDVPFTDTPLPALVRSAARILTCEALWLRRGHSGDANPWTSRANDVRRRLEDAGRGDVALTATTGNAPSIETVTPVFDGTTQSGVP